MVELSTGTATTVAAGGAAVVLLLLVLLARTSLRWRGASRRLAAIATRLEQPGDRPADDGDVLSRLERQAQTAVLRLSDEQARAERLAAALGHVGLGVVVCDEHGRVAYRNGPASELAGNGDHGGGGDEGRDAGVDRDGGAGRAAGTPVAATDAVHQVLRAAVAGSGDRTRTVELSGPPWRTLRVTGHAIDDGRRVVGGVALVDDVSERRRLDVVRRDFLTNMTAELQAPVAALGLLAGTIVAEDDPALTRRLAGRLEQDALRVGRLVDDLAELSRLDSQVLPPSQVLPVHLLVAQAVEEARPAGLHRSVSIDASGAPADLAVVGDRRQLVSALRHLVENALRFSEDSTGVAVRISSTGGWVDVAVADEGPGIPPDQLDRVFECFFRAGRDRVRTPAGTGVGLAIASRVAACHGGQVQLASTEGAGSTFTLRLPAGPGAAGRPGPDEAA